MFAAIGVSHVQYFFDNTKNARWQKFQERLTQPGSLPTGFNDQTTGKLIYFFYIIRFVIVFTFFFCFAALPPWLCETLLEDSVQRWFLYYQKQLKALETFSTPIILHHGFRPSVPRLSHIPRFQFFAHTSMDADKDVCQIDECGDQSSRLCKSTLASSSLVRLEIRASVRSVRRRIF